MLKVGDFINKSLMCACLQENKPILTLNIKRELLAYTKFKAYTKLLAFCRVENYITHLPFTDFIKYVTLKPVMFLFTDNMV